MIKKLIGIIVAVAVVVIIVVAAIRRDNFQSMVRRDELLNGVEPAAEPPHLISPAELDVPAPLPPASDVPAEPAPHALAADSLPVVATASI